MLCPLVSLTINSLLEINECHNCYFFLFSLSLLDHHLMYHIFIGNIDLHIGLENVSSFVLFNLGLKWHNHL